MRLYPCVCTSDWGRHRTHSVDPNAELFVKHYPSQAVPAVGQVRYAMLGHIALGLRLFRLWGKSWSPWLLLGSGSGGGAGGARGSGSGGGTKGTTSAARTSGCSTSSGARPPGMTSSSHLVQRRAAPQRTTCHQHLGPPGRHPQPGNPHMGIQFQATENPDEPATP